MALVFLNSRYSGCILLENFVTKNDELRSCQVDNQRGVTSISAYRLLFTQGPKIELSCGVFHVDQEGLYN